MIKEKGGALRVERSVIGYLRTNIYTYMRSMAQKVVASRMLTFEHLHDLGVEFKKNKDGKRVIKNGGKIIKPAQMMHLEQDDRTLGLTNKLLEQVLLKVITNARFIANSETRMRVTVTKRDMMVGHALRKNLTDSYRDGLMRDENYKEYDWDKIRANIIDRAMDAAEEDEDNDDEETTKRQAVANHLAKQCAAGN